MLSSHLGHNTTLSLSLMKDVFANGKVGPNFGVEREFMFV